MPKFKAPLSPFNGKYPGHKIQMDLIENLPVVNGYKSILVIIDTFTKWSETIALRSTKVEHIAHNFLVNWICKQGVPVQVHSDRGGNLESAEIIKEVYKMMGIYKSANTSYRPQTDGGVERLNRTIKNMLWKFCQKNPANWVLSLPQVMFAYRTSVHSSTGFSPFFLDKGRLPRLPIDLLMGTSPTAILGKNQGEAALEAYTTLQDVFQFVEETLQSKHISSKNRHDLNANVRKFEVGNWVYVWKPVPQNCSYEKFYDHYRGPFKIVEKMTTHTYKIVLDESRDKMTSCTWNI